MCISINHNNYFHFKIFIFDDTSVTKKNHVVLIIRSYCQTFAQTYYITKDRNYDECGREPDMAVAGQEGEYQ